MLRAAIYARVSSLAQRDAHTIDGQLLVLRDYVRRQGWTSAGEYLDDGRSAKTGKLAARDGFARLVRDAEAGRFDVLVIVDVDRLTRTDSIEERAAVLGPFQRLGIRIVSPSGGDIDLRTMFGQLDATLRALYGAEENRKRAERVKAGKLRAIAEGRKPAGPTPYGLAYARATGTWSLHPQHAPAMREIVARVGDGETCNAIADDLCARGVPGPRGKPTWNRHWVWQLVRSTHSYGVWVVDKARKLTLAVPPIVDVATWQRAQDALIASGRRNLRRTRHVYLIEGLASCASCGSPIHVRTEVKPYQRSDGRRGAPTPAAYLCRARKLERRGERRCNAPIQLVSDLDARVWDTVAAVLRSKRLVDAMRADAAAEAIERRDWEVDAAGYRAHLARLDKVEASLLARFRRGAIGDSAMDVELAALGRERTALRAHLAAAQRAASRGADEDSPERIVERLRDLAATELAEDRRAVVQALVRRAVLDHGRLRLTLAVAVGSRAEVDVGAVVGAAADCRTRPERLVKIRVVA